MGRLFENVDRDSEIWRLRTVEGLTAAAIAERVGVNRNTVNMALLRRRRALALDGAPKPGERPESPRDLVLRLSLAQPPMTVERIAQATGLEEGLVRVIRRRLRAAGHQIPLVLRDGNTNALDLKATITGARCRCSLLCAPGETTCGSCLPDTAAELATSRRGGGPVEPACMGVSR